jgi:arabinose-5-phosphate isomerase
MSDADDKRWQDIGKKVLKIEADAILSLIDGIGDEFSNALTALADCPGRVVITGMGKAGIIARKIAATMASTGTLSLFVHPAEAVHGDLGMIHEGDVVIAISNSGETDEITRLLPLIKKIGAVLISLTGNSTSTLARHSDFVLDTATKEEACPLGLAPTASTTASLAMGDALAMALLEKKGFRSEDYAFYHPGGSLGKNLLMTVGDIMRTGPQNPVATDDMCVKDVLFVITSAKAGAASIVDADGKLVGVFTDGDLRRHVNDDFSVLDRQVQALMSRDPWHIFMDRLAAEGLKIMRTNKIDELPVTDAAGKVVGMLDVQDLLRAGIM